MSRRRRVWAGLAVGLALGTTQAWAADGPRAVGDSNAQLVYTPVAPCRILDTRVAGGALVPGVPRQFRVTATDLSSQGGNPAGCNVPFSRATAALINFVAVNPTGAGNLRAWAYRTPLPAPPNSSVLNYAFIAGSGLNIANGIGIPICDPSQSGQTCAQDFLVQADGNTTHVVADVVGFFERFPTEQVPARSVPTGTIILWDQSNVCPTGYDRVGSFDGRFLRGAASPGATGGSDTHTHDITHAHPLDHTHGGTTGGVSDSTTFNSGAAEREAARSHTHPIFTSSASGTSGSASPSASSSASGVPPYADVLFCRKLAPAPPAPARDTAGPLTLGDSNAQLVYTPVAPCRIIDTRVAGGSLAAGVPREFSVTGIDLSPQGGSGTGCNVPFGRATAALINFTAVNAVGPGNLRAWAYQTPPPAPPNSSVLNYAFVPGSGLNVANGIAIPICDRAVPGQLCPFDFRAQADGNGTQLVADVVGFFERFPTEELSALVLPAGAVLIWDQSNTCPTGFTRVGTYDGRFLQGNSVAGGTGGASTHAHGITHTHTMANHTHTGSTGFPGAPAVGGGGIAASFDHDHASFTTGGPSANTTDGPSTGTSGSASSLPPYRDVLLCRKVPPAPAPATVAKAAPETIGDATAQLVYTPVAPCRIADTRAAGGPLVPGTPRDLRVTGGDLSSQGGSATGCSVPSGRATAALINFVAVNPSGPGNLRAWAFRTPPPAPPNSSVLNYAFVPGSGLNLANGIAIPICNPAEPGQTCALDFRVQADGNGTQLVADVVGFFERFPTEDLGDLAVPAGAVVIWDQSGECPAGYTRTNAFDARFFRAGAAAGGTGGSATHAHDMAHTHTLGGHTHSGTTSASTGISSAGGASSGAADDGHTHNFTTGVPSGPSGAPDNPNTGAASSLPPYIDVLFCRKD